MVNALLSYLPAILQGKRLPLLIALSVITLILVAPVSGASDLNLTLVPQNAMRDPSVSLLVYAYGEPVTVNATLTNTGTDPVTIMGYPPKAGIYYRLAYPFRTFDRAHHPVVLEPGQSLFSPVSWDQRDARGLQVDPGTYTIGVNYLFGKNVTGSWDETNLEAVSSSVDLLILPRGGAYRGIIAVNESETQENVTATLESVSFSNDSWSASVLFRFPDNGSYDLMSTCNRSWLEYWSIAQYGATYSFDNITSHPFFDMNYECSLRTSERFVFMGEPVPADTQNISINITSEWMNPVVGSISPHTWNYRVNLPEQTSSPDLPSIAVSPQHRSPLPVIVPIIAAGFALVICAAVRSRRRP